MLPPPLSTLKSFRGVQGLPRPANAHEGGAADKHAKHYRDAVIPAMTALRETGDELESIIPHDLWPLATYREMLFIK